MSAPKIPKGWKELRRGAVIRSNDRVWAYGEGPWVEWGKVLDSDRKYRPCESPLTDLECHYTVIRRIEKKGRK